MKKTKKTKDSEVFFTFSVFVLVVVGMLERLSWVC